MWLYKVRYEVNNVEYFCIIIADSVKNACVRFVETSLGQNAEITAVVLQCDATGDHTAIDLTRL